MKVCKSCHKVYKPDQGDICHVCHEELIDLEKDNIEQEEVTKLSEYYHQQDVKEYDKIQNGLCFSVLGTISIIVGCLFIVLSFVKKKNKIVGINMASLQFVICVICLILGISLLTYGLVRIFMALDKRLKYKNVIKELANLKTK